MSIEIVKLGALEVCHFHHQTTELINVSKEMFYLMFINGVESSVIILKPIKK